MKGSITHDYLGLSLSGTCMINLLSLIQVFMMSGERGIGIVMLAGDIRAGSRGRLLHDICLLELCCPVLSIHSAFATAWAIASDMRCRVSVSVRDVRESFVPFCLF